VILLGAMFDHRVFTAHVSPVRANDGPLVVRSADLASAGIRGTPFVVLFDDPQPPTTPNVAWSVDGSALTLESRGPSSDGTAYLDPLAGGATTLHAYIGPPVNQQIDTPVFAYRSFMLGCTRRSMPGGAIFSSDGASVSEAPAARADLYVRGTDCGTPRRFATALVAPLGLTFVPTRTLAEFAAVSARAWHASTQTAAGFATYGTLLVRLHNGRTLKFFMQAGGKSFVDAPYAIAQIGGEFADVGFLASPHVSAMKRLPDSIRMPAPTARPESSDTFADPEIARVNGALARRSERHGS
jgi:hypothetical protein